MKKNLEDIYLEKINNTYKEGIIEDLRSGRHLSVIISGYGIIYANEHIAFKNALNKCDWFDEFKEQTKLFKEE